jgi:two-component system, LytTR family, response regulator
MYTCIIVDDQPEAVELIKDHIGNTPALSLKLATTDPMEAMAFLDKEQVDIIFLDVQMPGLTGIEILENLAAKLGHQMPKIVFTTGYNDYALPGYEYGVADYLLKPVSYSRFRKAADRIFHDLDSHRGQTVRDDFVFADVDGKKMKLNFCDIIYIEGARNYIIVGGVKQRIITYKSMNAMQEILPAGHFMRVHKSYIVAIDKIQALRGNEICVQWKDEGKYIPIGITYKEKVLKQLKIIA